MNIVGILAIMSPVGIAFAIYVYFANKRIKINYQKMKNLRIVKKVLF